MYVHESKGILEKDTLVTFPEIPCFHFGQSIDSNKIYLLRHWSKGIHLLHFTLNRFLLWGDSLNAEAWIRRISLYTFVGLHVVGDLKISTYYLQQMIGLEIGKVYYPEK